MTSAAATAARRYVGWICGSDGRWRPLVCAPTLTEAWQLLDDGLEPGPGMVLPKGERPDRLIQDQKDGLMKD